MTEAICAGIVFWSMLGSLAAGLFLGWCIGRMQGAVRHD